MATSMRAPGGNELVLFTPQYDVSTGTDNNGLEILVELERPTLIVPEPDPNDPPRWVVGVIRGIYADQGNTVIPFDHVVISARGSARAALESFGLSIGDQIGINQEITQLTSCPYLPPSEYWLDKIICQYWRRPNSSPRWRNPRF